MSDSTSNDPGPQAQPEPKEKFSPESKAMGARLLYMILIAIMIGVAQTVLHLMTVIQFIIMLTAKGRPNEQIAHFGRTLGEWQAKAARFQTAASEDKPWPWSSLG